jgi:hypothetical protein
MIIELKYNRIMGFLGIQKAFCPWENRGKKDIFVWNKD